MLSFSCVTEYKGADEKKEKKEKKEAMLPSIVRASRHGKSYFVAARTGTNPKKQHRAVMRADAQ